MIPGENAPWWRWIRVGLGVLALLGAVFLAAAFWPRPIPADALDYFTREEILTGRAYTRWHYFYVVLVTTLQILFYILAGRYLLRRRSQPSDRMGRLLLDVLRLGVVLTVILDLVLLPFRFWRGFIHAHAYGLSTQTLAGWFGDTLLGWGVGLATGLPVLLGLYFLIRRSPRRWWIAGGLFLGAVTLLTSTLAPVLIDPLFYDFQPVRDPELRQEIRAMAARADLEVGEILVADASRRTTAVNAYFTGVGGTRRIVLYDNLVNGFPRQQVLLVLAHEIGHWKLGHITQGILLGTLGGFFLTFLLSRLLLAMTRSGHLAAPWDPRGLGILLLLMALLTNLSLPLQNAISRTFERQADRYSVELTGDVETFVRMEEALARRNLADVAPSPVIENLYFTHPSALERIENALALRAARD